MGGSGSSGWLGRSDPETLRKKIREAENAVQSDAFEAEVEHEIGQLLAAYNDRDSEAIGGALEKVKEELGEEFEMAVDLRFGGSVSKKTYVDGLSDVDALVLVHRKDVANKSPDEIKTIFADRLRSRFGKDNVREGNLAVTLTYKGQEIQLLPAIQHGTAYKIPSMRKGEWSSIRPRVFSKALSKANNTLNGKLIPTIKLAKAIISRLPPQRQLTGYHTEVLAVSIFDDYTGPMKPKAMLRHFFEKLPDAVRQPQRDMTGQSVYLDSYLGPKDSLQRGIIADAMNRIARRIRNADSAQSLAGWRDLLREDVDASGSG